MHYGISAAKWRLHFKRGRYDAPCGVVAPLYDGFVMLRRGPVPRACGVLRLLRVAGLLRGAAMRVSAIDEIPACPATPATPATPACPACPASRGRCSVAECSQSVAECSQL